MDVLEEILASRKEAVAADKKERPLSSLEQRLKTTPPVRDFLKAVTPSRRIGIIAEMKKKSPSAGLIRPDYNVAAIAAAYEKGGVQALSVLTEPRKFGGRMDDIVSVRQASNLPILRKDFLFDAYQVVEARAFGADAVLLIADMLDKKQLKELVAASLEYKLEPLVEIFTEKVVDAVMDSGARLIGINTRNLRTLDMVPDNVARLRRLVPQEVPVVAESGIKTSGDMEQLKSLHIAAALIGESFLRQPDLEKAVKPLVAAGGHS